jgi:hypothetical protein
MPGNRPAYRAGTPGFIEKVNNRHPPVNNRHSCAGIPV